MGGSLTPDLTCRPEAIPHRHPSVGTIRPVSNAENIARTVRTYLALVGKGRVDDVVALYTENATVEDPVGGDVCSGIEAIHRFYHSVMDGRQFPVDLLSLNVAGGEAAFHFQGEPHQVSFRSRNCRSRTRERSFVA
jgi:ketosteroid isomerase-like protein